MFSSKKILITTEAQFDALADDWRQLETRFERVLPFQTYDWNRNWWKIFSSSALFQRDELRICTLYSSNELVAVMPLTIKHIGLPGLSVYRYVRPFGADPNLTELRVPLALPEFNESILSFWNESMSDQPLALSEFQLIQQQQTAACFMATNLDLHTLHQRRISNFIIHLGDNWDSFKSQLKRNIKESLRHCYNSLKRDALIPQLEVLRGDQLQMQLGEFYRLHGTRAAATNTVEHPDYFAHAKHREFIQALLDSPFAAHCLLFVLRLNGKAVAMRLAFHHGDEIYLYYSGYDLAYAKYSVMTTLVAECMQWAMKEKISRVNLSVGEDVSKTRWNPERVEYAEYHYVKNRTWRIAAGNAILAMRQKKKANQNQLISVAS
jgi:CelD/BcsL family acetyltransferase involved in cellulose biosynthesis